jgi:thiamine-monophosphate kinase
VAQATHKGTQAARTARVAVPFERVLLNPQATLAEVGEDALLHHLRRRIPGGPGVALGVGDDAAVVETSPLTLVTTDGLVEGVHFVREWAVPRLLGRKALSVNLSDVAAMAGIPRYAVVSLCLPPQTPVAFVDGLYDGLLERAAETGVSLVGGNLAAIRGPITISVTLLGQVARAVGRGGAQAGDLVVVTGTLGAAAAGLRLLGQGARLDEDGQLASTGVWTESSSGVLRRCLRAQLDPEPPLAFSRALAEVELVHAAIDLSDGLSLDLRRLCEASGLVATIDAFAVPVSKEAASVERAQGGDPLATALHGGEDYGLLLAAPPGYLDALKDIAVIWDLPLTVLGEFSAGEPEVLLQAGEDRMPLAVGAHDHFLAQPPGSGPP